MAKTAVDDGMMWLDDSGDGAPDDPDGGSPPWQILILDDESEVHNITQLALKGVTFQGRGLSFLSAFNRTEAEEILQAHPDVALILLDVVMEEDDTGLRFARWVREELGNKMVRIVLRTGQPGQAPERQIITDYDINDYRTKTELTVDRLYTTTATALRSYHDLKVIETSRRGLQKVIDASSAIFQLQSFEKLVGGSLTHLNEVMRVAGEPLGMLFASETGNELSIVAGLGSFSEAERKPPEEGLPVPTAERLRQALQLRAHVHSDNSHMVYVRGDGFGDQIIYVEKPRPMSMLDRDLIDVFCANLPVAIANIRLNAEMESTQKELVFTLGAVAEARSRETGYHVKRVAEYSRLLGNKLGLADEECELLRLASPLHDIGKMAIPDAILNKPGRHTDDEREIMRTHAILGYDMLKHSNQAVFRAAATLARSHHENWDGSGYPDGLVGEAIPVYGRITALADVFDALGSKRCYKDPWETGDILDYLTKHSGHQFDPRLVDIFFQNLDDFLAIRDHYVDAE